MKAHINFNWLAKLFTRLKSRKGQILYAPRYIMVAIALCTYVTARAQVPNQFTFQGVARDAAGKIITNANIRLHIRILKDNVQGTGVFEEFYDVGTNAQGLFTAQIGSQGGNIGSIDWKTGSYFLKMEIDPTGGNSFSDLGTTQILSVPYAMFSDQSATAMNATEANSWKDEVPIIQRGSQNSPSMFGVGIGNRLIWYPKKAAFRAGSVSSIQWEDAKIGTNSFATGQNTEAIGINSAAFGSGSVASGDAAFAIGQNSTASGNTSFAVGLEANASSAHSIALGQGTTATNGGVSVGKFNLSGGSSRIFQIGMGADAANRRNAFTVLANGNIGIGNDVSSPEYILDIGNRMRLRSNLNLTAGLWLDNSAHEPYAFIGGIYDNATGFYFTSSGWSHRFYNNGDAFFDGGLELKGPLEQGSDRRLKRDVSPLSNSLSKISNLSGKHYFWKDSTRSQDLQTGLIAQEVEEYFPELVSTDEKGFKSVNYIGLIPHLIESVKSLKAKTDELAALQKQVAEYKNLQAQVNELRAEMKTLHSSANTQNAQSK